MAPGKLWLLGLCCAISLAALGQADENSPQAKPATAKLTEAESKMLTDLIGKPLVDPKGKQYVQVQVTIRDCWGGAADSMQAGWLVRGDQGKPDRVYFVDGDSIAAPKEVKHLEFVTESRDLLNVDDANEDDFDAAFRRMRHVAAGSPGAPLLARAAWLKRLGREDLAAAIMVDLRRTIAVRRGREAQKQTREEKLVRGMQSDLAWSAFADGVHAFMQGADEESLRHAARLNELYPEFKEQFGDGPALLADLQRRQKAGTFGREAPSVPDNFDELSPEERAAWLIEQLDRVDARQWSQPGGVNLASDWRVEGLIKIGEPAVPALIDVIEKDKRLTRSVHFWRDFGESRTVLSVREAALTAVMSILRVQAFEPASTGDNFTSRGEEGAAKTAAQLRKYWEEYGKLPFDERMMKVLTDPKSGSEAAREAAVNLAQLGVERTFGTTVWSGWIVDNGKDRENPAVKKFSDPTVAEAILAARQRDLAALEESWKKDPEERRFGDYERKRIESTYLVALVRLGDKRIVGEVAGLADEAATLSMRRRYADGAFALGDPKPISRFAEDFRLNRLKLPEYDDKQAASFWETSDGREELTAIVGTLARPQLPATEKALYALAGEDHPAAQAAARMIEQTSPDYIDGPWFNHPFSISVLRRGLNQTQPTGARMWITEDGTYRREYSNGSSSGGIPKVIEDPAMRVNEAVERQCDVSASLLSKLVKGLPEYHPMLKDAEKRLAAIRKQLDNPMVKIRRVKVEEITEEDLRRPRLFEIDQPDSD